MRPELRYTPSTECCDQKDGCMHSLQRAHKGWSHPTLGPSCHACMHASVARHLGFWHLRLQKAHRSAWRYTSCGKMPCVSLRPTYCPETSNASRKARVSKARALCDSRKQPKPLAQAMAACTGHADPHNLQRPPPSPLHATSSGLAEPGPESHRGPTEPRPFATDALHMA